MLEITIGLFEAKQKLKYCAMSTHTHTALPTARTHMEKRGLHHLLQFLNLILAPSNVLVCHIGLLLHLGGGEGRGGEGEERGGKERREERSTNDPYLLTHYADHATHKTDCLLCVCARTCIIVTVGPIFSGRGRWILYFLRSLTLHWRVRRRRG